MDGVAYAYWNCICVGDSYSESKSCDYDTTYWIPKLVNVPKSPLVPSSCKNHQNWECIIVYVMLEETEAREASKFIRKSGGMATQKELDGYRKDQLAPLKIKRKKQYLASKKSSMAMRLERDNPEEAVTLLRESITVNMEAITFLSEQFDYRDFPYLYNRLTLLLERLGQFKEVLREIKDYEALPCHKMGSKSIRKSIKKRKIRLQRKNSLKRKE